MLQVLKFWICCLYHFEEIEICLDLHRGRQRVVDWMDGCFNNMLYMCMCIGS